MWLPTLSSPVNDINTYDHWRPIPQSTSNTNGESAHSLDQFSQGTCTGGATWDARSNLHSRQRSKSLSSPRLISKEAGPTSLKPRLSAGHIILYKMGSEEREEKQCRGSSRGCQDENLRFSVSRPRGHNPPIPDDAYSAPFLSSEDPNSSLILCFRTNTTDGSQWEFRSFPPTASKRTASLYPIVPEIMKALSAFLLGLLWWWWWWLIGSLIFSF